MNQCHEYIETVYKSPIVNEFISRIKPEHLQNDLKQELILILYDIDCNRIKQLNEENKLIDFVKGIIWKMGVLPNSKFYKSYRKNNFEKDIEYLHSLQGNKINYTSIRIAENILEKKLNDNPNSAHESIIFRKYVELRSCIKVADYFGIPKNHVFEVVASVKKELKKNINK